MRLCSRAGECARVIQRQRVVSGEMNSLFTVKHYIHNCTKTRQEEMLHVIVSSCIEYLAVEEEILHGRSMTSVANISGNSRINWPGNSVYVSIRVCASRW
jgi:hypothetical protein